MFHIMQWGENKETRSKTFVQRQQERGCKEDDVGRPSDTHTAPAPEGENYHKAKVHFCSLNKVRSCEKQ